MSILHKLVMISSVFPDTGPSGISPSRSITFRLPRLVDIITGLKPMRIGSRVLPSPHFVREIKIDYAGKIVLKAQLTFSVSMDPSFRFYFTPESEGVMTVEATDTQNNQWNSTYEVKSST